MKTQLSILSIAFIGLAATAQAAEPDRFTLKPYVGAEYQYTHINYEDDILGSGIGGDQLAEENLHGANIHIGARVNKHLGFEFGYLWTADGKKSDVLGSGLDSEINVRGFNLDALGYLPIGESERFELIGTVGVSRLEAEYTIPTIGSTDGSEIKPRFGAGAQYWLTDKVNVRGLVRYQGADFDGDVESAVTGNIGLNLQF